MNFRHIYILYGLNMNSHNDQLPDDLIAQLAEHCTDIAEFFRLSLRYCSSNVSNCDDQHLNLIHLSAVQIYMVFTYIYFRNICSAAIRSTSNFVESSF